MNPPSLPVMSPFSCDDVSAWLSLCVLILVDATVDAELKYLNKFIILHYFNDITKATHQVTICQNHFFIFRDELAPRDKLALSVLTQINNKQDDYMYIHKELLHHPSVKHFISSIIFSISIHLTNHLFTQLYKRHWNNKPFKSVIN